MMGTILPRRFEPIRVLRKGSACSTFVATDQYLGRNEVVVKVIGKGNFTSDVGILSEVLSWYRGLRHPFLSEVLDAGLTPKRDLFYVRNYHPDSEFFTSANRESVKALISAVDFLRSDGRVHGAIKPSNIFASADGLKLSDPWTRRSSANPKQLVEEDIRFSAPEVLNGGVPGLDSDLYSLGAVLYRFFSGRDPFEASDPEFLRAKYIWASPRSLGSVSHVSRRIAEIVTVLLDKDPARRGTAFESLKNELEVEAVPALRAPAIGLGSTVESVIRDLDSRRGFVLAVVEGPAGSGKSRFVEELRGSVLFGDRPSAVCEAVAPEPCVTLARRLLSLAEEYSIAGGLPSLSRLRRFVEEGQEPASKSEQEQVAQDLVDSFAAVGRQVRLLVVIEDVDRTSRRLTPLLERMAQQAADIALSAVATTRPAGLPFRTTKMLRDCLSENFYEVAVGVLSAAESQRLSTFLSVDPHQRARAERRAGGNPGFLDHFCKSTSPTGLPKQVRQVLSDLITKLPTKTKRVAEVLALFEEPVSWDVLSGVSEMPQGELREAVLELERLGLVSSDRLAIRYPDARTLLHSRLAKSRRAELHARCFGFLRQAGSKDSNLAHHAFEGGLFKVASELYRELATKSFAEREYTKAERYFSLVSDCGVQEPTVRSLDPAESIKLAKCLGIQGNKVRAQGILRELLESKEACEDSELLASVYSALASPTIEDSPMERVRLLRAAIGLLEQDSRRIPYEYGALTNALLSLGSFTEADEALKGFESHALSQEDRPYFEGFRGLVLMNKGMFREAMQCFSTTLVRVHPGSISNNLAVCIEQLGDIEKARDIQRVAVAEAEVSGSLIATIVSLTNLGAMETKLGNIRAAEAFFDAARTKLGLLERQNADQKAVNLPSSFADMANLSIEKGNFRSAAAYLASIDLGTAGSFFPAELFLVAMTRCELHLELEQREVAAAILNVARSLPLGGDYFEVGRLLVEERLRWPSGELCNRLEQALSLSEQIGTVYQGCRARIALARHLIELGQEEKAALVAAAARKISKEKGYKPLAASAMLLVGLSTKQEDEKESALKMGMEEAANLGFAPLVAEFAFWIGKSRFSRSDYPGAQEYLSQSISITARLADDLNTGDRKTYTSKRTYREARELFNEASTRAAALPSRVTDVIIRESSLFAKLYRLAAAMTGATDLNAATAILLQALKETLNQSVAVVLGTGPNTEFYSVRLAISEEARKRIISVASSAGDKPYIAGHGVEGKQSAVIWMPILSLGLPSGIYVESAPGDTFLTERDIEFLTVVTAVSGAAFDHLCSKAAGIMGPVSSANLWGIVGSSKQIGDVRARIEIAARNSASVLIEGESGTGKELVARAIHRQSKRATAPFIAVDCGALPEGLIEAELFGAKRGAYTGALSDRQGLFEAANQGTIFLDEIANLGIAAQAKLLRVLQEREIRMVGSITGKTVDLRLIAATNCSLEKLVREGKFRQDLLYRLKVLHILVPPLRIRKDDIPVLATTFLERLNASNHSRKYFGPRVIEKFIEHSFPGNVRELQNAIERAFYTSTGVVITDVEFFKEASSIDSPANSETESWFKDLAEGRENFWANVHDRYKRRDISRERLIALVDFGLRTTGGRYKKMASMLQIPKDEYHRFMDFLRRSECLLDFRPYRKSTEASD